MAYPRISTRRLRASLLSACLLAAVSATAQAEPWKAVRFTILAAGESVGYVRGQPQGEDFVVDYHVDNNGRGPKHRETLRFAPSGIPSSWKIAGTSLMGGPVTEQFSHADGKATWISQADRGEVASANAPLYVANDGSPWGLMIYEYALRNAPGNTLDVAVGGTLRREEVARLDHIQPGMKLVRIVGLDIAPDYLVLDAQGDVFAVGSAIREGHEDTLPAIGKAISEFTSTHYRALQQKLAATHAEYAVRNVRVLDVDKGALSAPSTVVVRDGKIAGIVAANAKLSDGVVVYDGEGGTLMPGLHDMHAHVSNDSNLFHLAAGVTTVRDIGNDNDKLTRMKADIAAGKIAGPRIIRKGFLEGRSPYSARTGVIADSLEEALKAVRDYAAAGDYTGIKIYNSMNPAWIKPIADEAHRLGLKVTGHVPAFTTPDKVIEAGYDEIAHFNQLALGWVLEDGEDTRTTLRLTAMQRLANLDLATSPRVAKTLKLMKEGDIAVDTTAVILERLMLSRAAGEQPGASPGAEHFLDNMPVSYRRYRLRTYVDDLTPESDKDYHAGVDKMVETMKYLHDNGIRLLPGTDDGTGFTVQREVELYARALGNADALRVSTVEQARYMGLDKEYGSIAPGKAADFFVVPGNPLEDINAIRKVRLVSRGNATYKPSEIYEAFGVRPFIEPLKVAE